MKDDYNKLPEYTNTKTVMHTIFLGKKSKWRRLLPTVAVIAGMLLFMIVALPYLNDDQQGDIEVEYLKLYYQQKKEAFRKELGIESVESFHEVKQAEQLVEQFALRNQAESFEQIKAEIDYLFTTPKQAIEQLNEVGESIGKNLEFGFKMTDMEYSLQIYMMELFEKYALTNQEQKDLIEAQHDLKSFTGPAEVKAFLELFYEQGFVLKAEEFEPSLIKVQRDILWIMQNNKRLQETEVFEHYLALIETTIDLYDPRLYGEHQIPWEELDTVLLKIENMLDSYPEDSKVLMEETNLLSIAQMYLWEYIEAGDDVPSTLNSDAREELISFVNNHRDSRYWEIVNDAVEKYELSDWQNIGQHGPFNYLPLFFDERFAGLQMEDLNKVNVWPILSSTSKAYLEYDNNQDEQLLEKLSSLEVLSLHLYAIEKRNDELVQTLSIADFEVKGWELVAQTDILIRDERTSHQETYHFMGGEYNNILAEVELTNEANMWKVSNIELYD